VGTGTSAEDRKTAFRVFNAGNEDTVEIAGHFKVCNPRNSYNEILAVRASNSHLGYI
jgi:hypothetical protein